MSLRGGYLRSNPVIIEIATLPRQTRFARNDEYLWIIKLFAQTVKNQFH